MNYDDTFEGGMVALLNAQPLELVETAYDRHLRDAWAPYDRELTQRYRPTPEQAG